VDAAFKGFGGDDLISCIEFVPIYSEFFKFLDERHGKQAVIDFWVAFSDKYLKPMRALIEEKGLSGIEEYWNRTLSESGGKYDIKKTEDGIVLDILNCPTIGVFRKEFSYLEPYTDYCDHNEHIFGTMIKDCGYSFKHEVLDFGVCRITVGKR